MKTTGLSRALAMLLSLWAGLVMVGCSGSGDKASNGKAPRDESSAKPADPGPPPAYLPGTTFGVARLSVKEFAIASPACFGSSANEVLASCGDGAILWNVEEGVPTTTFRAKGFKVTSIAYAPAAGLVLCGGAHSASAGTPGAEGKPGTRMTVGEATLWNVENVQNSKTFTGHGKSVTVVRLSPDAGTALTGGDDGTVILWDVKTGQKTRTLRVAQDRVMAAAFSPDGRRILTSGYPGNFTGRRPKPGTAILWDLGTGKAVQTFRGHMGAVYSVAFSPDGIRIVTGGWDRLAMIWDTKTGRELRRMGHSGRVMSVAFSPDGRRVLTTESVGGGFHPSTARLWDADSGAVARKFTGHDEAVKSGAFSLDGRRVVTASWGREAFVWDAVERAPEAAKLAALNRQHAETRQRAADDFTAGRGLRRLQGHASTITGAAFGPEGKTLVTVSKDGTAVLWNPRTGERLRGFEGHANWLRAVAYSRDGRHILTGSDDQTGIFWDAETGKLIHTFKGHSTSVTSVALSSDGRTALTGASDGAILWDTTTGEQKRRLSATAVMSGDGPYVRYVRSVGLSPDGQLALVSGAASSSGGDGMTMIWNPRTGEKAQTLTGHGGAVTSAAFGPGGTRVLTGSRDGWAILWDAKSGEKVAELDHAKVITQEMELAEPLKEGEDRIAGRTAIHTVAWSPDGKQVLTVGARAGSRPALAVLWNVQTAKPNRVLKAYFMGDIHSSAFSSDGTMLVTGGVDTAIIWDASEAEHVPDGGSR